jgi:xanthine dehydrogenase accessory factor
MSFDRAELAAALARHGRVARVVVAATQGSAPREAGAAMLVWEAGQAGTIGGGALEFEAAGAARALLRRGEDRIDRVPLGPALAQCCGGAVTLVTEIWDAARLAALGDTQARPLPGGPAAMPLVVARKLASARNGSLPLRTAIVQGWIIEPFAEAGRDLWIWGAGHVGRAIVGLMAPLPGWRLTWADTAANRFPETLPESVTAHIADDLAALVPQARPDAAHLIVTYSHALDLALCHALLGHGFGWAGLIGSETKWARFRSRLGQLGHEPAQISRICCPIGRKSLGKHPQAIAIGVAADLISGASTMATAKDGTG